MMRKTNDTAANEQAREEPSRELTPDELAEVSGGIIAVLIGGPLGGPYEPPPIKPGPGPV
jgi:hypothetical protein